jgi:hypothetical protein
MNKFTIFAGVAFAGLMSTSALAAGHGNHVYGPFPVTLKGYSGDKTNSVSYAGQVGRQLLHNSLKKAIGKNAGLDTLNTYFNGSDGDLPILDPVSSDKFVVDHTNANDISKTNLSGKAYRGDIAGWPGGMSGREVLASMIERASKIDGGYDAKHGYDYAQLVSKFAMGGIFYHQACDNYLDEKLEAGNKPNNKPYKDGAYYTGKEHSWDEAFGYWGAAAHGATLSPEQNYNIAKKKDMVSADANSDGVVNLKSEMNYAHAYYASAFDKGGKTKYYNTITQAFIDGRQVIADAEGEALTDSDRNTIMGKARVICSNWEKVIAEAVFKYAGSVYGDLEKLRGGADEKTYRKYVKHWGELKGFALSLHTSNQNLGELGRKIDGLIKFGPVVGGVSPSQITLNTQRVDGVDDDGNFTFQTASVDEYMLYMLRLQKLMEDEFGVVAKNNDKLAGISNLAEKLGSGESVEND